MNSDKLQKIPYLPKYKNPEFCERQFLLHSFHFSGKYVQAIIMQHLGFLV